MAVDPKEFEKFKDDAVRSRELEDAIGRYRMALFLAALGPAALAAVRVLEYAAGPGIRWAILATAPAGVALLILRFLQIPPHAKMSKAVLMIGALTLAAAGATFVLARKFSMLPF